MTLIFDGTIQQDWKRNGPVGSSAAGYGSGPNMYDGWSCTQVADGIITVPAPGGRSGYAVKIKAVPGIPCGSDAQHVMIDKNIPLTYTDVYYGYSTYMDPANIPQQDWMHYLLGLSNVGSTIWNSGFYIDMNNEDTGLTVTNNLRYNHGPVLSAVQHTKGVWHDWVVHIVWSTTNSGSFEIYHKLGSSSSYGPPIYSESQIATLNPANSNVYHDMRLGLYRGANSVGTFIFYTQGYKVAPTFDEVKYGGPAECPALTCNLTIGGSAQ